MSDTTGINLKLIVAYDGTAYLGWQKTPEGPSIEEALQGVIEQICQHPIQLQAASRTDAGVHANGQVVNFFLKREGVDLYRLLIGINALLPKDIAVLYIEVAEQDFHPTLDNIGKEYVYKLCYGHVQMPQDRLYEWHYPRELNIDLMRKAAEMIKGEHDFSAFVNTKKNEKYEDHIREVQDIVIEEVGQEKLRIEVTGNHFMYKMVRNIVGTLVYIGAGKLNLQDLPAILRGKNRTEAGMTAPAHGLFLQKVYY